MIQNRTNPEYWKEILVKNCRICNGTGYIRKDEVSHSVKLCECTRMVHFFVKMNDPVYGLNPKYHHITLKNAADLSPATKQKIMGYIEFLSSDNPYRNLLIRGTKSSGKTTVAAIIYKELMSRKYEVSIIRFSEIVTLSRMYISNTNAFNERREFYDLLKEEEFIIIEDVDNRGEMELKTSEKLGYGLLDEIFSYRANHPCRATIVTADSDVKFVPATLGRCFYSSIFSSDVIDNQMYIIDIEPVNIC